MDPTPTGKLVFDGFTLDPRNARLLRGAVEVPLRPKAFDLLHRLVLAAPDLLTKEQLLDAVWPGVVVGEASLVQCVREIRLALGDDAQQMIRTVPRRGYAFARPVQAADGAAPGAAATATAAAGWRVRRWPVVAGGLAAALLLAAAVLAWRTGGEAPAAPLSIAVLPLRNLSGDADQDYLAEALGADLNTDLARLPGSRVTARASAARYRDPALDSRRVGAELGVRYLVQGQLSRVGDVMRLNLQLIEAESGRQLWTQRFEEPRDRLAVLQRDATAGVARTLQVRLADAESQRGLREHAAQPQAEDLTLRGWYLWQQSRPDSVAAARELLLRAVALDPDHAYAWACLTLTYVTDLTNNWIELRGGPSSADWLRRADEAAERAFRLDRELPAAIGARAAVRMLQGRSAEAIALREKQIAATPNDPIAHLALGALALHSGHPEQVLAHEQEAMRVSPRDPRLQQMMGMVALAELHLGHDAQAMQWAERAVAADPGYGAGHGYLAASAALLGDAPRAQAALTNFRRALPKHRLATLRAEFDGYSAQADYRAGMERLYEGLRRAGLEE